MRSGWLTDLRCVCRGTIVVRKSRDVNFGVGWRTVVRQERCTKRGSLWVVACQELQDSYVDLVAKFAKWLTKQERCGILFAIGRRMEETMEVRL